MNTVESPSDNISLLPRNTGFPQREREIGQGQRWSYSLSLSLTMENLALCDVMSENIQFTVNDTGPENFIEGCTALGFYNAC